MRGPLRLFAALALLGAGAVPLAAQTADPPVELTIARQAVELHVAPDGSWEVTEAITFRPLQGRFSFGARSISTRRMDALTDLRVESPDLEDFEGTVERDGVRWEHAPSADEGTVIVRYRVEGALRDLGDRNEIFWAAVGDEGTLPVDEVRVSVHLPLAFAASAEELEVEPDGRITRGASSWLVEFRHDGLEPRQAYQVRIAFPWVMEGRSAGSPVVPIAIVSVLLLLLGLGVGLLGWKPWRRPDASPVSSPPPVTLEEASALLHGGARAEAAYPSIILDLAHRGHLTLVQEGPALRIHPDPADPLRPFEQGVLEDLEGFESVEAFGKKGGDLRARRMEGVREGLVARGLLRDREEDARGERRRGYLVLAVSMLLPFTLLFASPWMVAGAAGGFGFALGLLVRGHRPRLPTPEGRRIQAELLGWFARLRSELERTTDPVVAADRYLQVLPWLTLDPGHRGRIERDILKGLDRDDSELPVPAWIENDAESAREKLESRTAAHRAFVASQETVASTSVALVPSMAHWGGSSSAGGAASMAGMGAAGASGAGAAGGGGVSAG